MRNKLLNLKLGEFLTLENMANTRMFKVERVISGFKILDLDPYPFEPCPTIYLEENLEVVKIFTTFGPIVDREAGWLLNNFKIK